METYCCKNQSSVLAPKLSQTGRKDKTTKSDQQNLYTLDPKALTSQWYSFTNQSLNQKSFKSLTITQMRSTRRQRTCGHFRMFMFGYIQFSHAFSIQTSHRFHIRENFTGFKFGYNLRQKNPQKPTNKNKPNFLYKKILAGSWAAVTESAAPSSKYNHTTSFRACIKTLLSHRRPNSKVHLLPTATNLNCITKPLTVLAAVNPFLKQYKKQVPCYQPSCWIRWKSLQIKQFPPTQTDHYSLVFTKHCSSKYKAVSSSPVFISESYSYQERWG